MTKISGRFDYIAMTSGRGAVGNIALESMCFPIASLFKVVLAYGAFRSMVITADEELPCADGMERAGRENLNVRDALLHSSNAFFRQLMSRIRPVDLVAAMRELQFPSAVPAESRLTSQWGDLWHGGDIEISPREVFRFTGVLAKLAGSGAHAAFISSLERPSEHSGVRIYGKTGTWGGAAWCTGFAMRAQARETVEIATVLARYDVPGWELAHRFALQVFDDELMARAHD